MVELIPVAALALVAIVGTLIITARDGYGRAPRRGA